MRIVVLGGGFGGVATVRHLERMTRRRADIEITIVSRENFFVLTPLLFEACSGRLELRHCAQPIRPALRRARFVEATVEEVDVERHLVRAVTADGGVYELPYDQLVVTLGARGAAYVAASGFDGFPVRRNGAAGGTVRTAMLAPPPVDAVDPTGCGDVFGASLASRLLAGDALEPALAHANRMGARNAVFRGARGLSSHLRGELVMP